jgi:aconitate hydratase 2/2-methylisocitrate dehydratase
MSTSTRNFDNRMGKGARVYLGSRRAGCCLRPLGADPNGGGIPADRCHQDPALAGEVYRYLNFHEIPGFEDEGRVIPREQMPKLEEAVGIQS